MANSDLLTRIREFAAEYGESEVSSAKLAMVLEVDPRTIAAALRKVQIRPETINRVPVYRVAALASAGLPAAEPSPCGPLSLPDGCRQQIAQDALQLLSSALGHDVRPALRAAGLL